MSRLRPESLAPHIDKLTPLMGEAPPCIPAIWFLAKDGVKEGPLTISQVYELTQSGKYSKGDLVWRKGMPTWQLIGECEELRIVGSNTEPVPRIAVTKPIIFTVCVALVLAYIAVKSLFDATPNWPNFFMDSTSDTFLNGYVEKSFVSGSENLLIHFDAGDLLTRTSLTTTITDSYPFKVKPVSTDQVHLIFSDGRGIAEVRRLSDTKFSVMDRTNGVVFSYGADKTAVYELISDDEATMQKEQARLKLFPERELTVPNSSGEVPEKLGGTRVSTAEGSTGSLDSAWGHVEKQYEHLGQAREKKQSGDDVGAMREAIKSVREGSKALEQLESHY